MLLVNIIKAQVYLFNAKNSLGEFWLEVHRYIGARIAQV